MTLSDKPDIPGYIAPNGDKVLSIVYERDGVTTAATGVHTGVWLAPLLSQVERDSRLEEIKWALSRTSMDEHVERYEQLKLQSLEPGREATDE